MQDTTKVKEELMDIITDIECEGYQIDEAYMANGEAEKAAERILNLIDKYTRESLINTLEDLKRTDWVGNDDQGEYVEVNDLVVAEIDSHIAQLTEQKDGE